jgi:hypothetical protein
MLRLGSISVSVQGHRNNRTYETASDVRIHSGGSCTRNKQPNSIYLSLTELGKVLEHWIGPQIKKARLLHRIQIICV